MIYSKEFYLKKFQKLKPKLEKQGFEDFAHHWYTDGLYTGSSENDTVFFDQPDPEEEQRYLYWEPCFKCRREDSQGIAHLEGHLEDDGHESYWVLEINYYKKPFKRRPDRSPLICYQIVEILENHIKDIPKLIKKL